MKIKKEELSILSDAIKREWIITNGIGGYSASTVVGMNTRKYHGLLVAPLTPPARRFLILSKLDESIEIDDQTYNLYTNMCKNYMSDGHKYLEEFEKDYIPIFTYKVKDVTIKKLICLEHGKNTVCVLYKIKNDGETAKFKVAPIINFRDFHTVNTNHDFKLQQEIRNNKVKLEIDEYKDTPIYMYMSKGNYIEHYNDNFRNMYYIEEDKRGLYPEENHAVPGRYEVEIAEKSEREINFICSLEDNIEEIDVKKIINQEIIRINELMYNTGFLPLKNDSAKENATQKEEREFLKDFMIAIDNFIVYRPMFTYHTLIAGYPWFLDWGRDSLISFEGILLLTNNINIAKEVLLTIVRDIKFGLVPNGYSGYDNRPLYNSVDSSLLLFEQVQKYINYTKDYKFIENNIYKNLKSIIENYQKGIDFDDNNIHLEKDGLISSGTESTQNTWMDAKFATHAFTPRNGKAVEINSLWYNALKIIQVLAKKFGDKEDIKQYEKLANKCQKTFIEKFYNPKKKCLFDVLGDSKVRPNQLFALSLTYPVIEPNSEIAKQMIETVEKKLLNKYGLKTLAKGEKGYVDTYSGDAFRRDSSYHQGITWPWLLGLYYNSLKNMIIAEKDKEEKQKLKCKLLDFKSDVEKVFLKELNDRGTVGTIAEIYDSKQPNNPNGTMAQCWSVAEIFRIIYDLEEEI